MERHRNEWHLWTVWAAAMIILCSLSGCKSEGKAQPLIQLSESTPVRAVPVTRVAANRIVTVSGTLVADKTAPLSFLVPGKVDRVHVDEGDRVKGGDLLATVESHDYRNNLEIAEAALLRARDAYDRYEPLYREGAYTEKSLIELRTGLTQAVAARDIARKALADTELRASIPGIVGTKGIELGQLVSPQVLAFTIVKTDVVYARVSVPESEIGQVAMDQNADVTVPALAGRSFRGRVSMIGAVADQRTRTFPVKIELANGEGLLRPGMIVQTGIVTDKRVNMLTVQGSAIVRDLDNLTYVFVADVKTGSAQRRRVLPGSAYHNEIEIRSGLTPNDAVIVSGQHKLSDGAPITLAKTGA